MALIEIEDVAIAAVPAHLIRVFALDLPQARAKSRVSSVEFKGWALGESAPLIGVELVARGLPPFPLTLGYWRSDVAEIYPDVPGAERSGFGGYLDFSTLARRFRLDLVARLADGVQVRMATIRGHHTDDSLERLMRDADVTLPPWLAGDAVPAATADAAAVLPRCSIILPVFNRAELTRQCLDGLLTSRFGDPPSEIIVVDDGSTDGTADLLAAYGERIVSVRMAANTGFAAACNAGAALAGGDFLVFLNNDTIVRPGWLSALVDYADDHPAATVVGAKLLFPDDTVQHAGVAFLPDRFPHHLYAGFPADHPAVNRSRRVPAVTAACCLVRRGAFAAVGGFDRAFHNGWEDVDLCLRLGERGHEIHFCHESVIYHLEFASRDPRSPHERRNRDLFARRWRDQIVPDLLEFYLADGLLDVVSDTSFYPVRLRIDPLLALVERDHDAAELARAEQTRLVEVLRRSNVRLHRRVAVARPAPPAGALAPADGSPPASPSAPTLLCRAAAPAAGDRAVVSVVVALDDDSAVESLRSRLAVQSGDLHAELIAVVGKATDRRVETLRRAGATVLAMPRDRFAPGEVRNAAAGEARGEVVVFLDPRATPVGPSWLTHLIAPLLADSTAAAVTSRVVPREDADLLVSREGFHDLNAAEDRQVRSMPDRGRFAALQPAERRKLLHMHFLATAVRRRVVSTIPFPAIAPAVDELRWAREVLDAGFTLCHEPAAVVRYSPPAGDVDLLQRGLQDGLAALEVADAPLDLATVLPQLTQAILDDWHFLRDLTTLHESELDGWRVRAAVRRTLHRIGQWAGASGLAGVAPGPPGTANGNRP